MKDLQLITITDAKYQASLQFSMLNKESSLAQRVVKLLLTAQGSDYFNTSHGSKLLNLYGVYTEKALDSVRMSIEVSIENFVQTFKKEQDLEIANGAEYELNDLLENIIIKDIKFSKEYSGWEIELEIINKALNSVIIVVP